MATPVSREMTETGRRKIRPWVDEGIKHNRNIYTTGRIINSPKFSKDKMNFNNHLENHK